ncbi:hypothetical protein Slin14017_G038640 [Septoria linicola]|nr:hypothetical protein Slin14017_G038640 [Septoria linicola]
MPAAQAQQVAKAVMACLVACSIAEATTERSQGLLERERPSNDTKGKQRQSSDGGPGWY